MAARNAEQLRRAELARIHLLAKEASLDDDTYRALLERLTGQRSAAALDWTGRKRIIDYLARTVKKRPASPAEPKAALIGKIEALLLDTQTPWAYAHGIARQMWGVEKIEWLDTEQLRGIVTALVQMQRRKARNARPD